MLLVEKLYAFLVLPVENSGISSLELNSVKTDVCVVLEGQTPPPHDYGAKLVEMFSAPETDPVWRDYCAQRMGAWYKQAPAEHRRLMRDVLFEATRTKRDGGIAGTALIALNTNQDAAADTEIPRSRVIECAFAVATDKDAADLSRTTAYQVGAQLGDTRLLAPARALAQSGEIRAGLRISAISAIGFLGTAEDLALLEEMTLRSDVRFRSAGKSALDRLKTRIGAL